MSMTLILVRVSPAAFATLERAPEHLAVILDAEDFAPELGIADDDQYPELDYRGAAAFCEAHGLTATDPDDDPVLRDLGVDGKLGYEAPYGPAFSISPASAKRAATSSLLVTAAEELQAWVTAAAARGAYIVGVVI
jgi:hypothetical protein